MGRQETIDSSFSLFIGAIGIFEFFLSFYEHSSCFIENSEVAIEGHIDADDRMVVAALQWTTSCGC
jgi:hypothetical protein